VSHSKNAVYIAMRIKDHELMAGRISDDPTSKSRNVKWLRCKFIHFPSVFDTAWLDNKMRKKPARINPKFLTVRNHPLRNNYKKAN